MTYCENRFDMCSYYMLNMSYGRLAAKDQELQALQKDLEERTKQVEENQQQVIKNPLKLFSLSENHCQFLEWEMKNTFPLDSLLIMNMHLLILCKSWICTYSISV